MSLGEIVSHAPRPVAGETTQFNGGLVIPYAGVSLPEYAAYLNATAPRSELRALTVLHDFSEIPGVVYYPPVEIFTDASEMDVKNPDQGSTLVFPGEVQPTYVAWFSRPPSGDADSSHLPKPIRGDVFVHHIKTSLYTPELVKVFDAVPGNSVLVFFDPFSKSLQGGERRRARQLRDQGFLGDPLSGLQSIL